MTHTLEATGISRGVARALRLNEDLTEAIGLGHDLGHPPFGHAGEHALDEVLRERFGRGFRHNEHSLRVVEHLERDGRGLNLTEEVRDGILHHTGSGEPATLEGKIVRLVDRVAYINHDIDDAIRAGLLRADQLPEEEIAILGDSGSRRIDRLVHDLVETSEAAGDIRQSPEIGEAMLSLRSFMFERVYLGASNVVQNDAAGEIVQQIFAVLIAEPERLPPGEGELPERITDFVAGMTDRYALAYLAAL
jgi:dGTPase